MLTGDPNYWAPMKPRVNLYELENKPYDTPRFSFDAFTASGENDKVIGLSFETSTTNVGQCFITIEDSDNTLKIDEHLMKGCRIKIDLSKDGSSFQTGYKGLVRAINTQADGITGRNITLQGYNFMVRLNERIVKINRESSKTGNNYDRTDSSMFTNNLLESMYSSNTSYIYSDDDFGVLGYDMLQYGSIDTSSVATWIPKLDVEYGTLGSAIDEVLESSGALLRVDHTTDNLILYDPSENVTSMGVFIITNTVNKLSDDADITMYPLENSSYRIGYDSEESANRLIFPFKHPGSHLREDYPEWSLDRIEAPVGVGSFAFQQNASTNREWGMLVAFDAPGSPGVIRAVLLSEGNCSGFAPNSTKVSIYTASATPGMGTIFGGPYDLWPQAPDGTFPDDGSIDLPSSATDFFLVGMADTDNVAHVTTGKLYWLVFKNQAALTLTNNLGVIGDEAFGGVPATGYDNTSLWKTTWRDNATGSWGVPVDSQRMRIYNIPPHQKGAPELNLDWVVSARDATTIKSFGGWLGPVERTVTSVPQHIDTLQTIQEYLYPRLYLASKARISFEYPSLTMPNKIPKAGDVICHYDTQLGVGTPENPQINPGRSIVQTSVISDIGYDFSQDADGVLGLRKLSLSTAGIRKGMY